MTWDWSTALIGFGIFILAWIILRWLFKKPGRSSGSGGGSIIGDIAEGIGDAFD